MPESWAREAVIYQIYPRSFADSDGDGVGDLPGVTSRLDYLVELGVDALWLNPFYASPMADGGYDVSDHRAVDPVFGTLADVDRLLAEAHRRGLRVIVDLVPNHTSDRHPWFQEALRSGPGSPARDRYLFRDGRDGGPPNNWRSVFGGPAWTQVPDGQWYLHLFAPEQPDLNWEHPEVREEYADILRFWLDRGVDGVRIDVAHGLVKAPGLPDDGPAGAELPAGVRTPYWDQDGVHDIYRHWRAILDRYTPERIAVAEAWVDDPERLARYVRPDELHQAFNFALLTAPWSADAFRRAIDGSLSAVAAVGAAPTWVLSNHDVVRHATRYGYSGDTGGAPGGIAEPPAAYDPARGLARARAATLMMLALPGSAYLYQGEELGLPEVTDLPAELRQDPLFRRSHGQVLGRDGCRVPLPWSGDKPPFGFSTGTPWLPQPEQWASLTVAAQAADPGSTLAMYRRALRCRRRLRLGRGPLSWRPAPDPATLVFERPGLVCAVNCGDRPVRIDGVPARPELSSGPLPGPGVLPADTAAWWVV
ncbi:MAG: glycoside hydrolase family 13 protein [Micromonosporaceae bacterium]|jgi:alpha-glucosidase